VYQIRRSGKHRLRARLAARSWSCFPGRRSRLRGKAKPQLLESAAVWNFLRHFTDDHTLLGQWYPFVEDPVQVRFFLVLDEIAGGN